MFTLKATSLLALPLLASAGSSSILASRAQRRSELLELLQHNHEKRWEQYNEQPLCEVQPGTTKATFVDADATDIGKTLAGALTSYVYPTSNCMSLQKCQDACVVDGSQCIAIAYVDGVSCTLYGTGYNGETIQQVPPFFSIMTNAGTTSPSSGGVPAQTVATCATIGGANADVLLSPSQNGGIFGKCQCGEGRTGKTQFTCQAAGVPSNYFSADNPPQVLSGPVETTTAITWTAPYTGVPAVMNNLQCASICAEDANCQAYLLAPGTDTSSCYKIGLSGVYDSPTGPGQFPFTPSSSTKMMKRAAGQTGSFGGPGMIFGQPGSSSISTNLGHNPGPSQKAGLRKRTMRHMGQSQW